MRYVKSEISNLKSQILLLTTLSLLAGCAADESTPAIEAKPTAILQQVGASQPAPDPEALADFKKISETLGRTGELHADVYTVTVPRDDLSVSIDSMAVPTAAGIESTFKFYRCHCGRTVLLGQLVVADYETNDVIFALQKSDVLISSVGPFLIYEQPRLMCIRFQSEGNAPAMAEIVKSALSWTAKHRGPR
jgi:hypothetical protein